MLIDELIELSKHVESKEDFLKCQKKIEELEEKEKKEVLELLKQHKFNKNYLDLLFETDAKNGIGFNDMAANLKFIHAIVDDNNAEIIIEVLNECHNLYCICDENWMIEIFKYVEESNYKDELLNLIDEYFEIRSNKEAYNETIAVLNAIQKLNYSDTIIDYFYRRYDDVDFGTGDIDKDDINMLINNFDAELFEKHTCMEFYQNEDFVKLDMTTQLAIFDSIKKLSDEQKEDEGFLDALDYFLINEDLIHRLNEEVFCSLIYSYISLYEKMKEENSFLKIFNYVVTLVDNGIFQADSINSLMGLYNKHIENDTILEVLQHKDVIDNSDGKTLEIMINTIENLDEDSLPIKKGEIYYTIMQGCEKIKSNPNELFLLIASYDYNPEVLNFICKSNFTTMEEVRGLLNDITITPLEEEMDKCSDINEITNYLMFLKENMNDTETLDLTPKSMVKKREYCNLKMKDDTTAPVDKIKN